MFKEWNDREGEKKKNHHHAGLQQRDPDLSLGDAIYCHSGHLRNGCWCVADFHSFGKLQMFSRRVPKRKREAAKSSESSTSLHPGLRCLTACTSSYPEPGSTPLKRRLSSGSEEGLSEERQRRQMPLEEVGRN